MNGRKIDVIRNKKCIGTGALGHIGSELINELRKKYGNNNVIATDLRDCDCTGIKESGPFHTLDVMDYNAGWSFK